MKRKMKAYMAFYNDGYFVGGHSKTLKGFIKKLKESGIYEHNYWGEKLKYIKRQKGLED